MELNLLLTGSARIYANGASERFTAVGSSGHVNRTAGGNDIFTGQLNGSVTSNDSVCRWICGRFQVESILAVT